MNPNSPKNERLEDRLTASLSKYFLDLDRAFPYGQIDAIYNRYVQESAYSMAIDRYAPVLATLNDQFKADIEGHLRTIYLSGSADMVEWGKTNLGKPILYEGPPWDDAIKFADKYGAELVTKMDEETKRRLAKIVSDGIKNKRGIPGLKRDIKADFKNMSDYRARMIAQTESNNALSEAFMDRSREMGVTGKSWIVFHPCPICQANADAKAIPLEATFPSGHSRPSAHPNCKCTLAPVMLDDKKKPMTPAATKKVPTPKAAKTYRIPRTPSANVLARKYPATNGLKLSGTLKDRAAIEKAIHNFELKYGKATSEYCISIDKYGKQVFFKHGAQRQIEFSAWEVKEIQKGEVFLHNHPGRLSFSGPDIVFASNHKIKNVMVIASDGSRYKMVVGNKGWTAPYYIHDEFNTSWNSFIREQAILERAGTIHNQAEVDSFYRSKLSKFWKYHSMDNPGYEQYIEELP